MPQPDAGKIWISSLCRTGSGWKIVASFTHSNPTAKAVICPEKRWPAFVLSYREGNLN